MSEIIKHRLADLSLSFALFDDWEDRYRYIIDLGQDLPAFADTDRIEDNRVLGCASRVWLVSRILNDKLTFHGDSDAHIVKGLIAILMQLLNDAPMDEVKQFSLAETMKTLQLDEALSSQRTNGLINMVRRLQSM